MSPLESVLELRDKILTLVVRHPQPCSLHARKLAGSETGLVRFAILVELIGFDYAKTVFDGIPQAKWERIHQLFFDRLQELRAHPPSDILSQLHLEFVGATLSWDPERQSQGAFDFLKPLELKLIHLLLRSEQATSVALLSLEWGEEDVARILGALPQPLRRDSVLAISRLRRMPEEILVAQGRSFATHLRQKLRMATQASKPVPPPFKHPVSSQPSPWSRASTVAPVVDKKPVPAQVAEIPLSRAVVAVDDSKVRRSIERITALSSFLCAEQDKAENAVKDLLSGKKFVSVQTPATPATDLATSPETRAPHVGKNRRLPRESA